MTLSMRFRCDVVRAMMRGYFKPWKLWTNTNKNSMSMKIYLDGHTVEDVENFEYELRQVVSGLGFKVKTKITKGTPWSPAGAYIVQVLKP